MLNNIEAERARNQLTQEKFAEKFGITPKTYRNWVQEETDIPSSALIRMSRFFGVSMDYLLEGASVSSI